MNTRYDLGFLQEELVQSAAAFPWARNLSDAGAILFAGSPDEMSAVSVMVRLETDLPREIQVLRAEADRLARSLDLDATVRVHASGKSCTVRFTRVRGFSLC